ncbi:MAG: hypothetical protein JSS57_07250 [Proteobacteria bacterium]|nr:hypothetical protein [Pseudomonadota bacterium]
MDWNAKDAITKQIDELLEKQTFSAAAVDGIKALRDRVAQQEAKIAEYGATIGELNTSVGKKRDENIALTTEVEKWRQREIDITAREAKMTEVERKEAVAAAKLDGFQSAMSMVFKNTIVREHTAASVPVATTPGGGYVTTHPSNSTVHRETDAAP